MSLYANGIKMAPIVTTGTGTITDVQVNGTSVVTSGVANVPVATTSVFGVVKADGTNITATNGVININQNQTINITYSDGTTASLALNGTLT